MIPALVLTAGLATRLRPLSRLRAKAALPVAGVPLIERIVRQLVAGGVTDLVLNLHHLPETIASIVGDGSHLGASVRYSWEVPILGSAGGPARAVPLLGRSPFLIVNGDTLTNLDVGTLVDAHCASDALVTMAIVPNREPRKYGGVLMDDEGRVTGFVNRGSTAASFHFIGVQAASASAFAAVPAHMPSESVASLYPSLISGRAGAVRGFVTDAEFFDIGTPADYLATSLAIAARESGSDRTAQRRAQGTAAARQRVDPSASVSDCVLWEDVVVGAGARLDGCIATDGVTVPAGSVWSHVTIRPATADLDEGEQRIGDLAAAPITGVGVGRPFTGRQGGP